MIEINWNNFRAKFNGKENSVFESLAYMLFCYEYGVRIGIFRFKNQTGIETEPIEVNGINIGFQAKYYDTKLSDNKNDLIDSLKKAKSKNPSLNKILIYTNQELSESRQKEQKKSAYQIEIEGTAQQLTLEMEWRVPCNIEKQLSVPENDYLAHYFFDLNNGIIDFLGRLKTHTETILFAIQTDILFKHKQIRLDRSSTVSTLINTDSQVIILAGGGGSGKTAVIKDLLQTTNYPCYVFKAVEFNKDSTSVIFNKFGSFDLNDFLQSHKEEEKKVFVIDSAEKLADLKSQDVFIKFLSALIKNGWKIIFTTRNSYLDDLSFQTLEVYRLHFEIIRLSNLSQDELQNFAATFQFKLPDNTRLQNLILNLFYLNEYLTNYDIINDETDLVKFRAILWQKRIQNSRFRKDNIHLERERCFLSLAKKRCDTGNFFLMGEHCNGQVLSQLENDEIIKYESSQNGYFITHDIYEEWALEKLIEREYSALASYTSFFENIGNSLPIRRAFRAWLSEKLAQIDSGIKYFIEGVFSDPSIPIYWKDELLISVLLSNYSHTFFETSDNLLLSNDKFYLKKIIFLLRTACKEVDNAANKIMQAMKGSSISPVYVFTKPKGKGWEAVIEYLYSKTSVIQKEELAIVLPLLSDWTSHYRTGNTTRLAGLFALHFYKDAELNSSSYYNNETEKALLKISLSAARELKEEMIEITDKLLDYSYSRENAFDTLREIVLTSNNDSLPFIITLPEQVIKLADDSWYQEKSERHKYDFGGFGIEGYYSIRSQWHHDYFPASALQTPVYYLLHFAFPQTIKFILDFTNRMVDAYFASSFDSSVHEIEVTIHSIKTKQFISAGLWSMYRGTGSPVTPYLLQSIHMALEKYLLEIAKLSDKKILQDWLIHLLHKTRSASITAVVTSVVLAYPDGLFDVAAILFQHYEFFRYDNRRAGTEEEAKSFYSVGRGLNHKSKEYEDERMATCAQPHRKLSLENLALQYQYFKNEGTSEEEVARRQTEIWRIIDHLHTTLPSKDAETDYHKAVRLLLTRIDRRKMNPTLTHEGDKTIIAFNPSLEPDLKEYSQEGLRVVEEKFKYSALKAWATNKFRSYSESSFPKYEENPDQVLKETKEIVEMLQHDDNEFHLYNSSTPAYTCAALIKGCSEKLSQEEVTFCNGIILSYAIAPLRGNYAYQIADGVEVAVSTLPFLYKQFPEHKSDYNHLLLFILFDTYPIGEYKRICDYAIEALNDNLFRLSPDDANVVLLAYLTLKPKFDQHYNLEHRSTLRKSRAQILEEFATKYESELGDINSTRAYYQAINFDSLGIQTAETAFLIIPVNTTDPIHFDFIKKVLGAFSSQILAKTDYSDKPKKIDYKLKHRFYRKYSSFLLHRDIGTIKDWAQPFVDAFTISREMADFLSDVVSEEDRLRKYDNFWAIWECFYPAIKRGVEVSNHGAFDEIIRNYLLAWSYWRDDAKEWHSLKIRETVFFKKASMEMGHHPAVLYSISKLLNDIGASFLEDGLVWLADMLSENVNLHSEDLPPNTIYYLEVILRKYVYLNRTKLKTHRLMKDKILILLDFLVSKGSVNGYLLREDIF